jgi:hypothetical protein
MGDFHNVAAQDWHLSSHRSDSEWSMFIDFNIEPFAIFVVTIALVPKIL